MDEAERVANEIAVIDHGKIIASGSPEALKKQTKKNNLEDAFLALTGHEIREEEGPASQMAFHHRLWTRR